MTKAAYPTQPGWYCIGFDREDKELQADIGPDMGDILEFTGAEWLDENGDTVDSIYDPALRMSVAMDAADHYVHQS